MWSQKIYERIRENCYDFVLKLPQNLDTNLIQKNVLEFTLEAMNAKRMDGEVSVNVNPTQKIIYVRIR